MPTSASWQEPDIDVSWEALPVPDKNRSWCSQPSNGLSTGSTVEELEKRPKELKGVASLRIKQQYEPTNNPQSSQGLNHQPKNIHGRTHGSSYTCSRGWPFQTSMRGGVMGHVKAWCPIVVECQDRKVGVGQGMLGAETRKGYKIWNVNKANI